jgi:taurine--2-oxoglutarate transaminase
MTTPPRTRQEILDLTRETTLYEWTAQKAIKPMVIDRAEGIYLWDVDGKRYMDFNSQLMCVNIGHGDQNEEKPRGPRFWFDETCLIL